MSYAVIVTRFENGRGRAVYAREFQDLHAPGGMECAFQDFFGLCMRRGEDHVEKVALYDMDGWDPAAGLDSLDLLGYGEIAPGHDWRVFLYPKDETGGKYLSIAYSSDMEGFELDGYHVVCEKVRDGPQLPLEALMGNTIRPE